MSVKRGEIYWVQFDPAKGCEQGGLCPAVVVQNESSNCCSQATVVAAITRTQPPWPRPSAVVLEPRDSGLPESCVVNCSLIATVQQAGFGARLRPPHGEPHVRAIGHLSAEKMAEVDASLRYQLALG